MKTTQYEVIGDLLKRNQGATAADLMLATCSTSIHKRLSEMKEHGWQITREPIEGETYGRYYGVAPKS